MNKYYDKDGCINEVAFQKRLEELDSRVDGSTLEELLKIRRQLYALKYKYEQSGSRYLDCEYAIIAINEVIVDCSEEQDDDRE